MLDPFTGSGTTGVVALKNKRRFVGIELKPDYCTMSAKRLGEVEGLYDDSSEKDGDYPLRRGQPSLF